MNWETIFSIANAWAMLGWLALILAPRKPAVLALILYLAVFLLCAAYTMVMGGLMLGWIDGGAAQGGAGFTSLAGVMALFSSQAGVMLGWLHYLAFDLFVGMWIARDADQKGFSRIVQAPILLLTLMAGPVGLFVWLVVRDRRARKMSKSA